MKTITPSMPEHPFLKPLSPGCRDMLLQGAVEAEFEPGRVIFREGELALHFYLIREGKVALVTCPPRREPVLIQTLGDGDVLGWSWLFQPFVWHFEARALERTSVLVLDAAHLLRLSNENHEFGYELMKRLACIVIQRLQATRRQLLARSGET